MNEPSPICLRFSQDIPGSVRARISYAFRVFAAIYNHRVADESDESNARQCLYSRVLPEELDPGALWIPARYKMTSERRQVVKRRYGNEDFHLIHGVDEISGKPDWLGEIFVWLSSSLETGIHSRDSVGRFAYSDMVFHREKISPRKPHAAMMMAWLEGALGNRQAVEMLPRAHSPVSGIEHLVVSSHDVDFYLTSKRSALLRLLKNLGISIRPYRSWSFFQSNSRMLAQLIAGKRVGDYLPALVEAGERCEFRSTLFVASHNMHRRDPNYALGHLAPHLSEASRRNFSVGLHGSYTSVIEAENLAPEATALANVTGTTRMGGRQHWLRFDHHEKLFEAVERAGLLFDSSLGFHEVTGFRNGASFAFPPYDFPNETPHEFLEIPLAIMDGSLEAEARSSGANPQAIADEVLAESRKWGWGGISVLWHNPIEPLQVPDSINSVFWECVKKQRGFQEKWIAADRFIGCCLSRYQNAGLLRNVRYETGA
jgi:hypothetical protein